MKPKVGLMRAPICPVGLCQTRTWLQSPAGDTSIARTSRSIPPRVDQLAWVSSTSTSSSPRSTSFSALRTDRTGPLTARIAIAVAAVLRGDRHVAV